MHLSFGREFHKQELANTAWAYAFVIWYEFKAQELTNTAWAYAFVI